MRLKIMDETQAMESFGKNDRTVFGNVVPPRTNMQERWLNLLSMLDQGRASGDTLERFVQGVIEDAQTSDHRNRLTWPKDDFSIPSAEPPENDPDLVERETAVFRAGSFLSREVDVRNHEVDNVPQLQALVNRKVVWKEDRPSLDKVTAAVAVTKSKTKRRANVEMEMQIQEIEGFMLLPIKSLARRERGLFYTSKVLDILTWGTAAALYEGKAISGVDRPWVIDPGLKTCLPQPAHSSWPSGHAWGAGAAAALLAALSSADQLVLAASAVRIAENRERGGLHTSLDTWAGLKFGSTVLVEVLYLIQLGADGGDPKMKRLWDLLTYARYEWS